MWVVLRTKQLVLNNEWKDIWIVSNIDETVGQSEKNYASIRKTSLFTKQSAFFVGQ